MFLSHHVRLTGLRTVSTFEFRFSAMAVYAPKSGFSLRYNQFQNMSSKPALKVCKLQEDALLPSRGSDLAAGWDLCSLVDAVIEPHGKGIVPTGLSIAVPMGTYGRVAPRSGLAAKQMIDVGAGVIDADYRGEVKVVLFNLNPKGEFTIKKGDRIAQLVLEKYVCADLQEVASLDETVRGSGGFGSTGLDASKADASKADVSAKVSDSSTAATSAEIVDDSKASDPKDTSLSKDDTSKDDTTAPAVPCEEDKRPSDSADPEEGPKRKKVRENEEAK
eukprot:Platyproteum_vivax@DN897_c0_g1_i1.p1